jgi:hypothetical protein
MERVILAAAVVLATAPEAGIQLGGGVHGFEAFFLSGWYGPEIIAVVSRSVWLYVKAYLGYRNILIKR